MIVAIDGPAGAGKSTIARNVAKRLGFQLVDTGAMYRTVALKARERGIDLENGAALAELASTLSFSFEIRGRNNIVFCNGEDVGDAIRTPENSQAASKTSALPEVRAALLDLQRNIGREHDSVLEGRDIGTVVFPDADVKIFLTASPTIRAKRRTRQLRAMGKPADYDAILQEIEERDHRDMKRENAPLKQADDAVAIDSTAHTVDEVVSMILAEVPGS